MADSDQELIERARGRRTKAERAGSDEPPATPGWQMRNDAVDITIGDRKIWLKAPPGDKMEKWRDKLFALPPCLTSLALSSPTGDDFERATFLAGALLKDPKTGIQPTVTADDLHFDLIQLTVGDFPEMWDALVELVWEMAQYVPGEQRDLVEAAVRSLSFPDLIPFLCTLVIITSPRRGAEMRRAF